MFCNRERKGEKGLFYGIKFASSQGARENPRFRRFMPLRAAGSDLNEKAWKSRQERKQKQ